MKTIVLFFFLISLSFSQIVLVTNKTTQVDTISNEMIKYLYLGKISTVEDILVKPYLSNDKILHEQFLEQFIDKSSFQYESYWSRLVFTGRKAFFKKVNKVIANELLKQQNTIIYMNRSDVDLNKYKIISKAP